MDNKEIIIQAAIDLINEKGERMDDITVREICKKANVGLGHLPMIFDAKWQNFCVRKIPMPMPVQAQGS